MILNPLQLKLAIAGVMAAAVAIGSLTIWALAERSGRLECKVELVRAQDQVAVLASRIDEQTQSIRDLGKASTEARGELRGLVAAVGKQHEGTRAKVDGLEASIKAATPR